VREHVHAVCGIMPIADGACANELQQTWQW
jgi:hypothetical protein